METNYYELRNEFETFENCFNLSAVTMPNSLRSIGDEAFSNCALRAIFGARQRHPARVGNNNREARLLPLPRTDEDTDSRQADNINHRFVQMKIVHISDTHGRHRSLPPLPSGDILVHTGDCTILGIEDEAIDFLDWMCDQPFQHKIFIAGNHDSCFYRMEGVEGLPDDVHYLCNNSIVLDGVRFYGVPLFFEDVFDGLYVEMIREIPSGIDVLLTHESPLHNPLLRQKIAETHPRAALFGHEHHEYGVNSLNDTILSNAAIVDNQYVIANKSNVIEI